MADVYDRETRRRTMQGIRKKNTTPELVVRSALHRLGLRFRIHVKSLPGNPDVVLARHRTVVLVNGCFWHQHKCKLGKLPKSNLGYWLPKLERNKARDKIVIEQLRELGWSVATVWECEARNSEGLELLLRQRLPRRLFKKNAWATISPALAQKGDE